MVPYHLHESDELSPQRESVSGLGKNSRAPGTGGDKGSPALQHLLTPPIAQAQSGEIHETAGIAPPVKSKIRRRETHQKRCHAKWDHHLSGKCKHIDIFHDNCSPAWLDLHLLLVAYATQPSRHSNL
eukprot:1138008-Pelagomonas_calceolata.AAC.1